MKEQARASDQLEERIQRLTAKEAKELLFLTMAKLALVRAQLDALTDLLVKKRVITTKKLWEETAKRFKE